MTGNIEAIIQHMPRKIRLAQEEDLEEVTLYSFQNDQFDIKEWFNHPRRPSYLDPKWLHGGARHVYEAALLLVANGSLTKLTLRYWLDLGISETGFALIGHLPRSLGTR